MAQLDVTLPYHVRVGSGAPPLVFVHGFGCAHGDWHAQLVQFGATRTAVACDLRGHGATAGRPAECSIETYGADVAELLRALDLPRAVLVGHSMGCRVVLQAALDAPGRVAGLVLIDGSRLGEGEAAAAARAAGEMIEAQGGYAAFAQQLFEGMFLPTGDPALRDRIVARARALPEAVGAALFARMVAWDAVNMARALSAVRQPLMVIQSTYMNPERVRVSLRPGETTPWLDLVRACAPRARIEIVGGVGHFAQLEAADEVNRLLEGFVQAL
ncbi:MAG: alpha/beta fold hydrolase [Burkholderiales bacterium]|nr:alpha/beta fold hydrolase [Burkholderiales bacterium]